MEHRERLARALDHKEVDRVPLDLGGTYSSTINLAAHENLAKYLGFQPENRVMRLVSSSALPDESVLRWFDIDTRPLLLGNPEHSLEKEFPDGSIEDEWGVVWARPDGGHWYVKKSPFADDADISRLDKHRWPDPHDPGRTAGLRDRARQLHEDTDYAVVLNLPQGLIHVSQFLRGFEEYLIDTVVNPSFAEALMERVLDIWKAMAVDALKETAGYVDVVFYADDIAIQESPMMSPRTYRQLVKPFHKAVFDTIRRYSDAKILFHSCGSIYPLLPDLVEMGVQAINPVQVSAADMDTKRLKMEYGDVLSFWGGVDTHRILPLGSTDEVRAEVRRRIDDLAPGGGYVLNSVHNIQADVPLENICAMFDEARKYRPGEERM